MADMTDWSRLTHAYGSAENIPDLLDQLVPDSRAEVWEELWSCICHQMTVYPASFAALPRLTEIARTWAPEDRTMILSLCGSIVAGARQPHGAGDVRAIHAPEIEELLVLTDETMHAAIDEDSFTYMLQALLAFENVPVWDESLDQLAQGEFELENCPGCGVHLFVAIGADGYFATSGDYAIEDDPPKGELAPALPSGLDLLARRMYDMAQSLGRENLAMKLLHLFGDATCPDCRTTFQVADQVIKQYG
ncbi:hypothetical protein [Herbidospora sp. RD11066]